MAVSFSVARAQRVANWAQGFCEVKDELRLIIFAAVFALSSSSWANEKMRPTSASQLPLGTQIDVAYRVKTAKVVAFNRAALERDFSVLRGRSDEAIRNWILSNFAFINSNQLQLNGIRNTPVDIDPTQTKLFHIPPGIGRGADVEIDGLGLVSLKATGNTSWNKKEIAEQLDLVHSSAEGLTKARAQDHSNGLETYDLATAEYLRQMEVQADYDRRNRANHTDFQTVESYFLIDYGFNLIYPDREIPAFLYGRQAHFGRTANNQPIAGEIYTDKGLFQETYTGTRLDFGGARTTSENQTPYHKMVQALSPEKVPEFLHAQLERLGISDKTASGTISKSEPLNGSAMAAILSTPYRQLERQPYGPSIGRDAFDELYKDREWMIDVPQIAKIKWALFQMEDAELNHTLDLLSSNDALENLFFLSRHTFQMPLPEAVYTYGFSKLGHIRSVAISAASRVLDRFPKLVEPAVKLALEALKEEGDSWTPSEIHNLISVEKEFPGYGNFLMAVMHSQSHQAKNAVLYRLSRHSDQPTRERVLNWVKQNEKDERVLKEAKFRFGEDLNPVNCRALLGTDPGLNQKVE